MGVIYKTTNLINSKIYIGKRIFSKDKFYRSKYYGSGKILKESIKKYGLENFSREVLEEVNNDLLDEREIYWIEKYNATNKEIGYNLTKGGNSKYGREIGIMPDETKKKISYSVSKYLNENGHPFKDKNHTEETKQKIRNKLNGRKLPKQQVENFIKSRTGLRYNKPPKKIKDKIDQRIVVYQLSLGGVFIKEWNSMMDASIYLNIDRSGISRACKGIYKQCGGYKWSYKQ